MCIVYILKSISSGKYYIGSTADLNRRLNEHQEGRVISTRNLRPLELVFYQKFNNEK
ncbi:MAG: GIY-YIG nuclease family protein [Armatimonadetes bacterium]|nr:GIY-YIG nuclease family protein [Armatimonadota bacterium]